ncbi:hypothetical protein [Chitinophaga sancti]|uniref:Uncharacterized protein n=1 Tax=Chitinophaga sancti TaxID=1004 RepID=A0A1K1SCA1_9BACT|nr:hypothetical protein [Chitinophaga sancti]WQD63603.1 hypothetical protein U0033_04290 [Chitinophaga sancti]WQG90772.1 hypothetical protein SR876_04630 [Chitinophaga sancti]SFW81987.1 hypothetical protein SAMN05661012_05176 [Chitinophaga sancti]
MKRVLFFIMAMCCLSLAHSLRAQDRATVADAIASLKYIMEAGKTTPYGFDIKYTYANESKPAILLDSLSGSIEIGGNNYYCRMDSTESIRNDRYSIIVFREDKLILLAIARPDSAVDPISNMQSMIVKSGAEKCKVSRKKSVKTIDITFLPGSPCKNLIMQIDTAAHHLLSVEYLLKSTLLLDPAAQQEGNMPEGYDEYAFVRTTFTNYHPLKPEDTRFKEEQYFYKEGAEYKPASAFSDYQVVLSTPNP